MTDRDVTQEWKRLSDSTDALLRSMKTSQLTPEERATKTLFGEGNRPISDEAREFTYKLPETGECISYNELVERYRRETSPRKGDWMQTVSGRQFWPLDPRPEEVYIEDIAHALSQLCRYGGQCKRFYSVAEHCVHVANAAPANLKLGALMHDASEAYLCDVIRPIKSYLTNYLAIEADLEKCIAQNFNLDWPAHPIIKKLDTGILADERDQAMASPPVSWPQTTEPPLGVTLEFWSPEVAKHIFLESFYAYSAART